MITKISIFVETEIEEIEIMTNALFSGSRAREFGHTEKYKELDTMISGAIVKNFTADDSVMTLAESSFQQINGHIRQRYSSQHIVLEELRVYIPSYSRVEAVITK